MDGKSGRGCGMQGMQKSGGERRMYTSTPWLSESVSGIRYVQLVPFKASGRQLSEDELAFRDAKRKHALRFRCLSGGTAMPLIGRFIPMSEFTSKEPHQACMY